MKEGLPFAQELSVENFADSYLCLQLAFASLKSLTSFSSIGYLSHLYAWFLIHFI